MKKSGFWLKAEKRICSMLFRFFRLSFSLKAGKIDINLPLIYKTVGTNFDCLIIKYLF